MSNHTPGPWAMNPIHAMVDAFDSGEPLPVCKMLWPTDARSEEQTEANATLIAAAPDLLDACRAAEEWLSGWASAEPYLRTIRAAIAKANGSNP